MKTLKLTLLLLFFILVSYLLQALFTLKTYQNRVDTNATFNIDRFEFFIKDTLLKEYLNFTTSTPLSENNTRLKSFYITLKPNDINKLNSNLPQSGKENYIKGYLRVGDDKQVKKIKLRYRGDTNLHWNYAQKSLRIKLIKGESYQMHKSFNLINPPHDYSIIDCVAYDISKELGLLSPRYEPVRVFINNQFKGVYIFLSQIDESLLRANKRMPGSIYYGDMTSNKQVDINSPARLFYESQLWDKKASRNAEMRLDRTDIDYFIEKSNTKNPQEFYDFANTMLNLPKYYTFFGLDTLFGAFHHDYAHNHKLYFDPYLGKFEPIEWDLRYWSSIPAKDISLYPLLHQFKLNPLLEAQRDKVAYEILQKYPAKEIIKRLRYYQKLILPDLRCDKDRDTGIRPPLFPNGIAKSFTINEFNQSIISNEIAIMAREKFLKKLYDNSKLIYSTKKISNNEYNITIEIKGNSPIKINNKKIEDKKQNELILYPARKFIPSNPLGAVAFLYGKEQLVSSPRYYSIISPTPNINQWDISNFITGKKIVAQPKQHIQPETDGFTLAIFAPKASDLKEITLKGTIEVKENLIFNKKTDIKILAGTTFIIHPKKSIFFYGKVTAIGTKKEPILFQAKNPSQPWGSVVIQGKETSNSTFRYTKFSNGSIATHNLINYTAPFNLHDLKNFTIDHCTIGKNHIGDDAMHIAYARGEVTNSTFKNARSDALDIDIATVTLKNNSFYNAGNDALDIMTTTLYATKNHFETTGDKGISVGEWSNATLIDNSFANNHIAIEVKDQSLLKLNNTTIKNARYKAINLYHKNKHYQKGGTVIIKDLNITGNSTITADKKSHLETQ